MIGPILVIEDEDAMRLLVQDYLEFLGYPVLPAPDGKTALELIRSETIALAFVDINLPDMSGVEVMQEMRDRGVDCPLIVLSGNLRESYVDEVSCLKVSEILEKPVDLTELERVIKTYVADSQEDQTASGGQKRPAR